MNDKVPAIRAYQQHVLAADVTYQRGDVEMLAA